MAIAAGAGIRRFDAEVLAVNHAALGVFKEAGFKVRRKGLGGEVTLMLDVSMPTESVWERIDERDHVGVVASLRAVALTSIAIVGAFGMPLMIPAPLSCQTLSMAIFKGRRCRSTGREALFAQSASRAASPSWRTRRSSS